MGFMREPSGSFCLQKITIQSDRNSLHNPEDRGEGSVNG